MDPFLDRRVLWLWPLLWLLVLGGRAQDSVNFPVLGEVIRLHDGLDALLDPGAELEVITSGYLWSEGPVWNKDGQYLLFSDIPRNSVMKWVEGKGATVYLQPSGYTGARDYGNEPGSNGLLFDPEGSLISCEHGDRRVSIMREGYGKRTLVDSYRGKRLNSPNDIVRHSSGALYFTDPPYGLPGGWNDPRRELDFCGVYRLGGDGKLSLLTRELRRPNGLAFSPDESILYVAQSDGEDPLIMTYPVKGDGSLGAGRVFFDASSYREGRRGLPDGLKVDARGNLWATGPGGVYVLAPSGELLGILATGEATSNCAWGGDGSVLYITADTYVLRIQTRTKGAGF